MTQFRARSIVRNLLSNLEHVLLWIIAAMLLVDVLLGIGARYVTFDIVFADELGKYLFIWLCALGISAATKDNQHVRLSFIAARLPISEKVVSYISQGLFLLLSLFMFYWSLRLTVLQFQMEKSAMGFHFPMYWFTAALPFGFGLTCARLLQSIVHISKGRAAKETSV